MYQDELTQVSRSELGIILKSGKYSKICEYIFPDLGICFPRSGNLNIPRPGNIAHWECQDSQIWEYIFPDLQGWIQDLVKGRGAKFFWPIFADCIAELCEQSKSLLARVQAGLGALEALGFFITKYAFSPFWGSFLYYF